MQKTLKSTSCNLSMNEHSEWSQGEEEQEEDNGDQDDNDDEEEEQGEEEEDEEEDLEKPARQEAIGSGCGCEPFSTRILQDGSSVTDVDLVSLKELYTSPEEQAIRQRYTWHPPSLSSLAQVDSFFEGFPADKVPYLKHSLPSVDNEEPAASSVAASLYREQQIAYQLPRQDMSLEYCSYPMSEASQAAYKQFIERRNGQALDVASVLEINSRLGAALPATPSTGPQRCRRCLVRFEDGQLAVAAPKFVIGSSAGTVDKPHCSTNNVALFHAKCFNCSTCKEFLVDLVYCLRDNKLYCVRHYGESLRPRCSWCRELIFSDEYLKAMNESFHLDHFLCRHCDSRLAGQRYVLKDDKPLCIQCYETNFANTCHHCSKPIGVDSRDLSYKNRHWHDTCFLCNKCHQSLLDKPFASKQDKVYCPTCYDLTFALRCDGCKNPFRAGCKKMEYKGKQWHDGCFCCCVCKNTIGSSSFIPKNEQVYCVKCYEHKYATKCTKCQQVIISGGVAFRGETWHRECFNCCNCNKSLAGQRFTTRQVEQETANNSNPTEQQQQQQQQHNAYCIDCYGHLFAKKCHACELAITGLGGTRFVSFEDQSWHNDCFICSDCQTSLIGKGFITDGPDIILCGECARAKLR